MFVCVLVYAKSNLVTVDSELENNKKIEMHNSVEEIPEVFFDPEYIRGYQEGYHALLENPYNRNPMFDENSSDAFKEGFLEGKDKAILDYGDIKLGFASK